MRLQMVRLAAKKKHKQTQKCHTLQIDSKIHAKCNPHVLHSKRF
jgi:hypothetical protein